MSVSLVTPRPERVNMLKYQLTSTKFDILSSVGSHAVTPCEIMVNNPRRRTIFQHYFGGANPAVRIRSKNSQQKCTIHTVYRSIKNGARHLQGCWESRYDKRIFCEIIRKFSFCQTLDPQHILRKICIFAKVPKLLLSVQLYVVG